MALGCGPWSIGACLSAPKSRLYLGPQWRALDARFGPLVALWRRLLIGVRDAGKEPGRSSDLALGSQLFSRGIGA